MRPTLLHGDTLAARQLRFRPAIGRWRNARVGRPPIRAQTAPVDERPPSPSPESRTDTHHLGEQGANGYPGLHTVDLLRRLAMERALAADGHTNGQAVNGAMTNGLSHGANGHVANGHAVNGHTAQDAASLHTATGHAVNGWAANGHAVNGHTLIGHAANGHATNALELNGPVRVMADISSTILPSSTMLSSNSEQPMGSSSHAPHEPYSSAHTEPSQPPAWQATANGHAVAVLNAVPNITLHPVDAPAQPADIQPQSVAHQQQQPAQQPTDGTAMQQPGASPQGPPQPSPQQPATAEGSANPSGGNPSGTAQGPGTGALEAIPKPILVISLVSACLTMASCVFNTLLPIYMVTELRMNMRSMGMFEGFLEAFSYIVRMFSGVVSDMMTSRKTAITLGFAMGAMAKFGMSGAATVSQLFAAKAIDRLANGVQAAPRDAMISDLAPAATRSTCFGFAQSMRKYGSFIGAAMCYFLMRASNNNYKLIFLMAASITVASTLAFVLLVPSHTRPLTPDQQKEEKAREIYQAEQQQHLEATAVAAAAGTAAPAAPKPPPKKAGFHVMRLVKDVVSMGSDYYRILGVICMYGLGHINESMLELRAIECGFGKAESTLVVALLALTISISAWPLGQLDDKHGPQTTFAVGMSALICGNLVLMFSGAHPLAVFASCLFLGVHVAVIQGPLLSIVVSLAPSHLRGTAFGIFYTVMAVTTVIANSIYGTVWHTMGANSAFTLSVCLMLTALAALPHLLPESLKHGSLLRHERMMQKQAKAAPA